MVYIIIWTEDGGVSPYFIIVDRLEALAEQIDRLSKKGKNVQMKVYESQDINYKITYTEKEEKTIKQIPNIEIIR